MTIDFDPNVDYYRALGVEPSASADEIKKAYRKLAKANHPDSTGGDKKKEARFKEVSSAYEVLGDKKKREQYDEIREQLRSGRVRATPGQNAQGGPQVWDLSDLFSQFFAGQGGRGQGIHIEMDEDGGWPFAQAQAQARARGGGRGRGRGAEVVEPPAAQQVRASDGSWLTRKGADVYSDVRLPFQDAILGTVRDVATLDGTATVKIPPGASSGQRLRLRGKGVSDGTREPGDHYVVVHIDVPKDLDDTGKKLLHDLVTHLKGQAAHNKRKS
jgi:DnaJ-class molecular chaperone